MYRRLAAFGLPLIGAVLISAPAEAQRYPLAPNVSQGEYLHPFFEGWYNNQDGTKTFSYGYFNRNTEDLETYIPRGPDNFIEPAEFDGMQPEHFTVRRERGVFTITVPEDWTFDEPVVWTLRNAGGEYPVPGTWRAESYELSFNMASGSMGPYVRFSEDGDEVSGIVDPAWADPIEADVGEAVEFSVYARDRITEDAAREVDDVNVSVFTHQGPALADLAAVRPEAEEGSEAPARGPDPNEATIPVGSSDPAIFTATFSEPGEYLLRVMVDNFGAVDSSSGNQCCWTLGYVPVTVTD